jgi:hypothetical protein
MFQKVRGIVVVLCLLSSTAIISSQPLSSDCVRKAIGVIEIAAQQDTWYAHFLRGLLSLENFPEEHARDIVLIAHMALTQSLAMNKPL